MSITVLNQKNFSNATAAVDEAAIKSLPNSRKIYVQGPRSDIQVPMREIRQTETMTSDGAEKNPPIWVYDTSGPYTDPAASIDIRSGLSALRDNWNAAIPNFCRGLVHPTAAPDCRTPSWPICVLIYNVSHAAQKRERM